MMVAYGLGHPDSLDWRKEVYPLVINHLLEILKAIGNTACYLVELIFSLPTVSPEAVHIHLALSPSSSLISAAPTTPPLNVTVSFNESSSLLEIRWVKPPLERIHGELQGYRIWHSWQDSKGLVSHQGNRDEALKHRKNPSRHQARLSHLLLVLLYVLSEPICLLSCTFTWASYIQVVSLVHANGVCNSW